MSRCQYCGKVIGYDRRFYIMPTKTAGQAQLAHALCHEEAVEKERMTDVLNAGAEKDGE